MGNWLVNHWLSVLFLVSWLGLNIFLFVYAFLNYEKSDKYYYTREILGTTLAFARASAFCLNFNSMMILIPVCRNLLSFLRGACSFCNRTLKKPLDHNLIFHKLVAYMICIFTAIHIIAHLFNFERYNKSQQAMDGSLASVLSSLSHQEKEVNSWLNPIKSPNMTVMYAAFTSIAGLTGVIATVALVLMVTSAMEFIRRNYFELFWYTHHLFIVYIICLVIHGLGGIVRSQTEESMGESHPQNCSNSFLEWDKYEWSCRHPHFVGHPLEFWKWILAPFIMYIFERLLRFYRSQQKVVITKVVMHPSKVLELQMSKHGFSMEVGQYVFVNCPSISFLEWHPFTLTSAPEEEFFSIHVRAAGDWTENLIRTFEQQHSPLPRIEVDGPFGTVSEDVFQYEVAVLVGAGIGVTPFASILKSIWYKFQRADNSLKIQKAGHAALNFDKATDILTGLKQKTFFGRPMWDNEFSRIATAHPKSVVGVFLCGPPTLAKSLRKCCQRYSSLDPRKVQFYFNKESF
ncbi:NADPH oxidase 1 isoform X2 [Psammomys obesus]|uniref:NADPH oxidase 1 isoform X2 n=1 Tax=Psammomys obesus TaxID=48139 RepID=UPI00245295DE|nr:NADPH oxidase 1 isoform X2 [Psammomys obesus]